MEPQPLRSPAMEAESPERIEAPVLPQRDVIHAALIMLGVPGYREGEHRDDSERDLVAALQGWTDLLASRLPDGDEDEREDAASMYLRTLQGGSLALFADDALAVQVLRQRGEDLHWQVLPLTGRNPVGDAADLLADFGDRMRQAAPRPPVSGGE